MRDYDRVRAWYATTAGLRAGRAQPCGTGAWAILTPEWAHSYAHNALLLTRDHGPEQVLDWVDDTLGGAGIAHRQVTAFCALAPHTRDGLAAAGYEVHDEVLMARPVDSGPLAASAVAVEQTHPGDPEVQQLQERLWREEWLPTASDETVSHLVGRRTELDRAGSVRALVVRTEGELVATIDVCIREGIAELDALATLADHRGRGYGQALMSRGVAAATAAGCDLVVLTALAADWPRDWYARMGFTELGPVTEATLDNAP